MNPEPEMLTFVKAMASAERLRVIGALVPLGLAAAASGVGEDVLVRHREAELARFDVAQDRADLAHVSFSLAGGRPRSVATLRAPP